MSQPDGDAPALNIVAGVDVADAAREQTCSASWLVFLTDEEKQTIEARQWPHACARAGSETLFHRRTWRGVAGWEVAENERGRCAFQQDNERCEVLTTAGEAAVPASCRHQPFRFVRCPDTEEVTVGVDWASVRVAPAAGSPLEGKRQEIGSLAVPQAIESAPLSVALSSRLMLAGWDEYREVVATLEALLTSTRIPLSAAVAALIEVPVLAARYIALMKKMGAAGQSSYSMVHYMRDQRSGEKQDPFRAQVKQLAAREPSRALGRRRLADAITVLRTADRGESRFGCNVELYGNRFRARRGRNEYRWSALLEPGEARALEKIAFPVGQIEIDRLIRGYLLHVLRRHQLLPQAGIHRGTAMMATLYAMIREVSRSLAAGGEASQVSHVEVREAIGLLERTVTLSEGVAAMLRQSSPLRRSLDRAFRPGNYAASVVLPLAPEGGEI